MLTEAKQTILIAKYCWNQKVVQDACDQDGTFFLLRAFTQLLLYLWTQRDGVVVWIEQWTRHSCNWNRKVECNLRWKQLWSGRSISALRRWRIWCCRNTWQLSLYFLDHPFLSTHQMYFCVRSLLQFYSKTQHCLLHVQVRQTHPCTWVFFL